MPSQTDSVLAKRFLERLVQEQAGCIALLRAPRDKTAFGYGQASGLLEGLDRAKRLFEEVIGEEDDRTS